jgi:hypothetical protein
MSAISKLSFSYNGSRITNFKVPYILCASGINGEVNESLYVPSIAVSGGRFSTSYLVLPSRNGNPKVTIKVSGTIGGSSASGSLHGQGVCDTDPQPFHANLGVFKPVATPKPKAGACTMAGCLASNGMFIKVTAVNRTIKGVDVKQGGMTLPADPAFQNGGVAVTITETDRSIKGPAFVLPSLDYQLRLGTGVLVPGTPPDPPAVNGNGAVFPCIRNDSSNPLDEATLTVGAHFGPVAVCFGAPTAAARQHLTLYYEPGGAGAPIYAKIPLG